MSRNVGVLYLSGKDKYGTAKLPWKLSIPAMASATAGTKLADNNTPISKTRTRRSANRQGRRETPILTLDIHLSQVQVQASNFSFILVKTDRALWIRCQALNLTWFLQTSFGDRMWGTTYIMYSIHTKTQPPPTHTHTTRSVDTRCQTSLSHQFSTVNFNFI